ncbi:MAG: DUF4159 domain-containing protein [Bacteroidales bacterium]|jgi:hypothetical protein|nr:DUF4159 domain-containing protein [Bacteroidales bacterium]
MKKNILTLVLIVCSLLVLNAQAPVRIALLKYGGGGDWYADPTALPNLIAFCNQQLGTNIHPVHDVVETGSSDIFNYPFVHMTGHGNVEFSLQEAQNMRNYLISGGFLHIDDNYGMDPYVRPQMKKVFPEFDFIELPSNHAIYNQKFKFPQGLPKIHEHDGKPPQGFGLFWEGRLVCYYTYETDISDGWEDQEVHNNSPETRLKALKMGANIIEYVFTK